ncbi:MAG: NADP-dependent oxidoreductase [Candidatus Dormibacteria bacterium]
MKAYALDAFGEDGTVRQLEAAEPGPGEVRVRVAAASLNAMDWKTTRGLLKDYMEHRFPLVPGFDFSGTVIDTGPGVVGFRPGERVFGGVGKPFLGAGTLAQQATVSASSIAHTPEGVSDSVAATIGVAGVTALVMLEAAGVAAGDAILIIGASGGVGSFAVQMARHAGARVLAVGRAENEQYLKSLGATEVIDYTAGDLIPAVRRLAPEGVAAIVDLVSDAARLMQLAEVVRDGGAIVSAGGAAPEAAGRGIRGANIMGSATTERLERVVQLLVSGAIKAPGIQTFPLEQAAGAIREIAGGHVRGKLVVEPGS